MHISEKELLWVASLATQKYTASPEVAGNVFLCHFFSVLCCQQQQQNSRRFRKMPQQRSRVIFCHLFRPSKPFFLSPLCAGAVSCTHTSFFCQRRKKIRGELSLQQSYTPPLRYKKQKMNETGFSALLV